MTTTPQNTHHHYFTLRSGRTLKVSTRANHRDAIVKSRFTDGGTAYDGADSLDAMLIALEQAAADAGVAFATAKLNLPSGRSIFLIGCSGASTTATAFRHEETREVQPR